MMTTLTISIVALTAPVAHPPNDHVPNAVKRWFAPQQWHRDTKRPILSLGKKGAFDDMHIFAPCVAFEKDRYFLWYCGSRGAVAQRVFQLGLAVGRDGKSFKRHPENPVFDYGDGKRSVLTAAVLRHPDGSALRDNGRLRFYFSATDFRDKSGLHTLHYTTTTNGVDWTDPSRPLLKHVYAPTVLKDGNKYRMWYTDVSREPWTFRYAESRDGKTWTPSEKPVMQIDQKWERGRLFYPAVIKADGVYLMWYGSYWSAHANKTALGFAVSVDGLKWYKHPNNPVLRPDPQRPWESHYTTSQSVMRMPDGSFRIWYASRKRPPFINKYFAICTAHWQGLARKKP